MSRARYTTVVVAIVLSPVLSAGVKFTSTWKAPDAAGTSFAGKTVAALIMSDDMSLRVSGEEALVRELMAVGVTKGVASYRIVPREELRDPAKAKGWYERAGVDGVVSMRLVSADVKKTWAPSTWTTPYYGTLWGYYGYGWGAVYHSGFASEDQIVVIETLIFSVPRDALLWAGVTETTNPKDAGRAIEEVVAATVAEMRKQGLIRRGAGR